MAGIGAGIVLAAIIAFTVSHANKNVVAVQTGAAVREDLTSVVSASGEIKPKVYVNVGAVTTRQTVRLAQQAQVEGVDFAVVITPYYVHPPENELVEHYIEVCRSVTMPVLAYNIPERTGVELTPAVLARVAAANPNFVGLKDSGGKLDLIPEWKRAGLAVFIVS